MGNAVTTCRAIQKAETPSAVFGLVCEYLSSLGSETAAILPASVMALCAGTHEIAASALAIAQREAAVAPDSTEAKMLKDVGTVLSTAAMRLAMLSAEESRLSDTKR